MSDKKCPHCGLWSTGVALRCDCGYDFEKESIHETFGTKIKMRDVTTGFFGWVFLSNLIFLLLTFLVKWNGSTEMLFSLASWLLTLITFLVLFANKKVGGAVGIAAAFIVNLGLWGVILSLLGFGRLSAGMVVNMAGNMAGLSGFPLPLGLWILFLGFA